MMIKEAGLIITQFLLHAQNNSIEFCHIFIGDDPQMLSGKEMVKLKDEFITLYKHDKKPIIAMVKGKPMPQTLDQWSYQYGLAEKAMLADKKEIERLKKTINQLRQKG